MNYVNDTAAMEEKTLEFCKKFSIIAVFTFYFIEELYYDANPFIFSY